MPAPHLPKIALEEAFSLPELASKSVGYAAPGEGKDLAQDLLDIQGRRVERMTASGVDLMVLSLTSPGPQDEPNPEKALALARKANDYLASEVLKNPSRFAGFASLSMHDPETALLETRRAIRTLGLVGIIINDFQTVSEDGEEVIFYDQPEWDAFWQEVTNLDVPFISIPGSPPRVSRKGS